MHKNTRDASKALPNTSPVLKALSQQYSFNNNGPVLFLFQQDTTSFTSQYSQKSAKIESKLRVRLAGKFKDNHD